MSDLRQDIEIAINSHSAENGSNTPDFILAEYLIDCLAAFDKAVKERCDWYGTINRELPTADVPSTQPVAPPTQQE